MGRAYRQTLAVLSVVNHILLRAYKDGHMSELDPLLMEGVARSHTAIQFLGHGVHGKNDYEWVEDRIAFIDQPIVMAEKTGDWGLMFEVADGLMKDLLDKIRDKKKLDFLEEVASPTNSICFHINRNSQLRELGVRDNVAMNRSEFIQATKNQLYVNIED